MVFFGRRTPGAIRLLTLLPYNEAADTIECTLSTANLDDNPLYDALSYVWGDENSPYQILVNNQPFPTTQFLREALTLLCEGLEKPLTLWVDAICINQKDLDERRSQVLQMRRIYACAQQTLVRLDDDDEQGEAYPLIIPLLDGLARCYDRFVALQSQGEENATEQILSEVWTVLPGAEIWEVVPFLFLSLWFKRVWTIQELAVASKAVAMYGQKLIEWSRLEDAIKMIQLARDYLESHPLGWIQQKSAVLDFRIGETDVILDHSQIRHIYSIYAALPKTLIALRRQTRENTAASLLSTLRNAWYHGATDPRDKVYALLGLVSEDERSRYQVDYSISTEQAYAITTKTMLQHDPAMEVLCLAGIDQRSTDDLPSWCPDWRTLKQTIDSKELLDREWLLSTKNKSPHQWVAGGTDQELGESEDWRVIKVGGTVVGVVGLTCSVGNHLNTTREALMPRNNDSAHQDQQATQYKQLKPLHPIFHGLDFDAIVDVVSLGTWAHISNDERLPSLGPKDDMKTLGTETVADWEVRRSGFAHSLGLLLGMMERYERKQTFVASDGNTTYVGIGSPSSEPGDVLCILHGARTPVLLRKTRKEGHAVLVGSCYVRGIMGGELMGPGVDERVHSKQIFQIC
ncbi:hypothetical protein IFR05_011954 [Cadophora sp. M221]|nr:hypothetical protein IFR05_011954 [Cadophora sp. M221]